MTLGPDLASEGVAIGEAEAVAALERFVLENDDLAELEAEVGRFNVFDALGVVYQEIRHSNFLGWLLDPASSHGQGALFLRPVLMDLLRATPVSQKPLSAVDLDGAELRGVTVRREWKHIDVLIDVEDPPLVVAIENKIRAGEHSNQLERYREVVGREFGDKPSLFVFLTREGDEPSDEAWVPYDYGSLQRSLERTLRVHGDAVGDEVKVFLGHYLSVLRSRFMDDEKIDALVERIYRQHRVALDLIFDRKGDPRKRVAAAFAELLRSDGDFWLVHESGYGCMFMPREWEDIVPAGSKHSPLSTHGLLKGALRVLPSSCYLTIHVGPHTDEQVREALTAAIVERGGEFGLKPKRGVSPVWWRVLAKRVFKPETDEVVDDDDTLEAIASLAESLRPTMEKVTPLLRDVFGK